MPNYFYVQQDFKISKWRGVPASRMADVIREDKPDMVSVLAASELLDDLTSDEIHKVTYMGPMYFDFDSKDIVQATAQANLFLGKLHDKGVNLNSLRLYASGSKGYHLELPEAIFMEKVPAKGVQALPTVYREVALALYVDTLDLNVYSGKRGRMWRTVDKLRDNGKYKVQITLAELQSMTVENYTSLTSNPRGVLHTDKPQLCIDLSVLYSSSTQAVDKKLKLRGKTKADPHAAKKSKGLSVEMLMDGHGIKEGVGFHPIALQIAIAAVTAGVTCDAMLEASKGLCKKHQSDSSRYASAGARQEELRRMYAYVNDNPCYTFSVGALKSILSHSAPDLDGIPVDRKGIEEAIASKDAFDPAVDEPDEFEDVSAGINITKYGIYAAGEFGPKRVCAVSFTNVKLLWDTDSNRLCGYEAEVTVNGQSAGMQALELDTFSSVQTFNNFCRRLGHAFQGSEGHIRGTMMRFVEKGKRMGQNEYIAKREGLDIVNIPAHDLEALRDPFMVWADNKGVVLDPCTAETGLRMCFKGFPRIDGLYRSDLYNAPNLAEWVKEAQNKEELRNTLRNLLTCQRPEVLGKLLGWFTAATYRMLFHREYNQFPLLHVHGSAGSGKSSMLHALAQMYYYSGDAKMVTPASTMFAISECMAASASIPLVIDEYKPVAMAPGVHMKFLAAFRTAYNCGAINKGGGTRDSDDYRTLHETQLSAPIVFIAEAAEEESAVAERIVQVTFVKPPSSQSNQWATRYQLWSRSPKHLGMLGKYIAAQAVNSGGLAALREDFDPLYQAARSKYMLSEADFSSGLSEEAMQLKQNAKERSVFNYTVALFGVRKLGRIVQDIFHEEFAKEFAEMEAGIYTRMTDLQSSTQPEWAKVLKAMAEMSYALSPDDKWAVLKNINYANVSVGGKDCVEIALRDIYIKYRAYVRSAGLTPLFHDVQPFLHSIKDSTALVSVGVSQALNRPGVYTFDVAALRSFEVEAFKG